jgi:hypothetical protein
MIAEWRSRQYQGRPIKFDFARRVRQFVRDAEAVLATQSYSAFHQSSPKGNL